YRQYAAPEQAQPARDTSNPSENVEALGTPDAVKEAASRKAAKEKLAQVRGRGVDWVRPTDLIAQSGGALSRRGIDLATGGSRRLRARIAKGAWWGSGRAERPPPLSAFGRHSGTDHGQVRSGVGMR